MLNSNLTTYGKVTAKSSSFSISQNIIAQSGNTVIMNFTVNGTLGYGTWITVASVPSWAIPNVLQTSGVLSNSTHSSLCIARIAAKTASSAGEVQIYLYGNSSCSWVNVNMAYLLVG